MKIFNKNTQIQLSSLSGFSSNSPLLFFTPFMLLLDLLLKLQGIVGCSSIIWIVFFCNFLLFVNPVNSQTIVSSPMSSNTSETSNHSKLDGSQDPFPNSVFLVPTCSNHFTLISLDGVLPFTAMISPTKNGSSGRLDRTTKYLKFHFNCHLPIFSVIETSLVLNSSNDS